MSDRSTPYHNPDDGIDTVDPTPSTDDTGIIYPNESTGADPVDYGRGGAGYFDPPGGGGGSYDGIF